MNAVAAVIVTIVIWPLVTGPTPLSIVHVGSGDTGSNWYVHFHVTGVATPAWIVAGVGETT